MRTITRNPAPACLSRSVGGQDWADFMGTQCHRDLAARLLDEQFHLCCYCETEIGVKQCHIEHMAPRSAAPGRTYDYSNLASSCNGGRIEHCGHYKDDRKRNPNHAWDPGLFCTPHDPQTSNRIAYFNDGSVRAASGDASAAYLISYIGLDCARLTERRKAHARALIDTLGPAPQPELVDWAIEYHLAPAAGRLRQFHSLSRTILQP